MGLTSLEISKNITELDWGAFQNLTNITYVYIPANIKKISGGCFANCYSLSKIDIEEGAIFASGFDDSAVKVYGKTGSYAEKWEENNTYINVTFVAE